jgi:4-hydroxybenzoate polyprenyltransferase
MVYLKLLRPNNWIKNLFIFAPLFFARDIFDPERFIHTLWTFAAFSVVASGVYVINDIADAEADRKHSFKNRRPLAQGAISVKSAGFLAAALFLAGAALVWAKAANSAVFFAAYIVLNILYSVWLKHIPVVDILTVSSFYIVRVLAGASAANVPLSQWLMLCTIFIAMFMVVGKRRAELQETHPRAVMRFYTEKTLDVFLIVTVTLTLVAYSLYTVLVVRSDTGVYAIFFVVLGLFRYLQLAYENGGAASPEKILLTDPLVRLSVVVWAILMYLTFYGV